MEEKLSNYRTKKRRQALLNNFKDRFFNMVSFQQVRVDEKASHVIVETDPDNNQSKPTKCITPVHKGKLNRKPLGTAQSNFDNESVTSIASSTSGSETELSQAEQPVQKPSRSYLTYITYTVYFLFWVTLYAIAIELRFGVVFLMFSALVAIYLNTRTEKTPGEISAYSVFNRNCEAIDGTLKAEQFEREIGIRH
ncbi:SAYSvFN domain-containing protein 1 [Sabethes cyaneus]|uniref:SAYSvFN domain-containing protein 1 n=1 Tax=Sabethes cyaneus TaxID=53552 RepID=UPI00221E3416|nr:SAYSvFN domain-containing protein 1 [Sabethes cyaneus]